MKDQKVNSLTQEEVFEDEYTLSVLKSNYLSKTSFGKNFSISITLFILLFSLSATLHNLPFIPFPEVFSLLFFLLSFLGLFSAYFMAFLLDDGIFKPFLGIAALLILLLCGTTVGYGPQLPKPITSTVPQSSASVKPSYSPKPGFTEPLKNSQSVHQKENR
jgi:hypothetical protein